MPTQKLLLPVGGEPLIRRTVRNVCDAGFDDVLVVVGSDWERTLGALDGRFPQGVRIEWRLASWSDLESLG